ncbi:hypothetical protein, partial [Candidatus Entotheonella palauensis]|uniref:hypothetical protein n=1 Tax=Candidatus Entotheonella palauensis TaxID=93172 RepID=UPI001C4DF1CC
FQNPHLGVARLQSPPSALPCIALSSDKAASGVLNSSISLGLGPQSDFCNSFLVRRENVHAD